MDNALKIISDVLDAQKEGYQFDLNVQLDHRNHRIISLFNANKGAAYGQVHLYDMDENADVAEMVRFLDACKKSCKLA